MEIGENSQEDILNFRDQLLVREMLSCGIGKDDTILHLGSGFSKNLVFTYLSDLNTQGLVQDLNLSYSAVDVDAQKLIELSTLNDSIENKFILHTYNQSAQTFLETISEEYNWVVITGIFNQKLYGEQQLEFVDKLLSESLKYCSEGVIFNLNLEGHIDKDYTPHHIISYIESVYDRYRINKINEFDYIFCLNKYYHSITH